MEILSEIELIATGIPMRRGRPRSLTPETRAQIVAALKKNPSPAAVARQLGGASRAMVLNIAKAEGIRVRPGPPPMSPERRAQIIALLRKNLSTTAIARQVGGVSHVTVWKIAGAEGIPVTGNRLPPKKRAEIVAALKKNPRPAEVARQIGGVSHFKVWYTAKVEGIPLAQTRRRSRKR